MNADEYEKIELNVPASCPNCSKGDLYRMSEKAYSVTISETRLRLVRQIQEYLSMVAINCTKNGEITDSELEEKCSNFQKRYEEMLLVWMVLIEHRNEKPMNPRGRRTE